MARQRYVYDAPMVAHLWAHQSQESARVSGGNFYFEGPSIYSYGSHFEIARLVKARSSIVQGGRVTVALFTNRTYSKTTSGHQQMARGAARHLESFTVPDLSGKKHKTNLDYFRAGIKIGIAAVAKARANKEWRINELTVIVATANRYCEVFGLRTRFELPDLEQAKELAKIETAKAERREKERKDKQAVHYAGRNLSRLRERYGDEGAKAADRLLAKFGGKITADNANELYVLADNAGVVLEDRKRQDNVKRWLAGENLSGYADLPRNIDVLLRIKGDNVETSMGAEFPLEHAKRILPVIRSGKGYKHNGHSIHLGHFVIDEITDGGDVKAGCHLVKRAEIERLAQQIGV